MTKTLTVIDLSSIFWQTWHATADQEVGSAFDGTVNKVYKHVNGDDPVVIAIDSPPYLRKKISTDYKSQRDTPSAVAVEQLRRVIERLSNDGFPVLGATGYEADDIIATIAAQVNFEGEVVPLHIITSDKDLLQLVDPDITVTSPLTGETFGPDEVYAKFGVFPSDLLRLFSLTGDKSDNVQGVPGVGNKTAAKIINGEEIRDGIMRKVQEHKLQTRTAEELIKLMSNAPIDVDRCFIPRVAKKTEPEPEIETIDEPEECNTDAVPPTTQVSQNKEPQPTQIVKRDPTSWALSLEPRDSTSAWKLARILFDSRLYSKFSNPEQILAVILRGRELGIGSTTALDGFHVINGQPCMSAALIIGLVLKSGKADYFKCTESTEESATYKTHRKDDPDPEPTFYTFDAGKAKRLGLSGKDNYQKQPGTMYRSRAGAGLARIVYPDVTSGLYTPDELSDGQFVDVEVIE